MVGAAVIIIAVAPGLSTMAAGLRVPQLPTAGQDLAVSDEMVDNIDERSQRAHFIYEGICLGLTIITVVALAYLALTSSTTPIVSTLLCLALCFAGAAARSASPAGCGCVVHDGAGCCRGSLRAGGSCGC